MLRKLAIAVVVAGLFGLGLFWFLTAPAVVAASSLGPHQPDLQNGEVMFNAGGCASCHAVPGQSERTRLGGGLALKSPFGTFYVPNISSDVKDGIGNWTEADFITAMVKGTSPRREHYYPAFPYPSYHLMREGDLRDMFAYLKTLPAVQGKVSDHDVGFPFNIRRLLGGWKLLFLGSGTFEPDPTKSDEWNRGAYLVNGPGHCAECHSPRNILGGIRSGMRFAGGPNPDGEGFVPNITQQRMKDWEVEDFAYLLATGMTPDGDSVGGSMGPVIRNTSLLPESDQQAMAVYLKSLAPVQGPTPPQKK